MSKINDSRMLKKLRETEFVRRLGDNRLIMPKAEYLDLKQNTCALCGKRKEPGQETRNWFGENFHAECVKQNDPNNTYDTHLRGHQGFSRKGKI